MTTPVVRELKRLSPHATRLVIPVAPPRWDGAVDHAEAAAASAVLRVVGADLGELSSSPGRSARVALEMPDERDQRLHSA